MNGSRDNYLENRRDQDGQMITSTEHLQRQVGNTFRVQRSDGSITGGDFFDSSTAEKIRVINEPEENSYYAIYESYGPNRMVGYLYIANHRSWPTKPFTYTTAGEYIYSGVCV